MRKQLKRLMREKKQSARDVARKADISESTVSHILAGRRGKRVSFEVVEKIAKAYGVSLDFFSQEKPHMEAL